MEGFTTSCCEVGRYQSLYMYHSSGVDDPVSQICIFDATHPMSSMERLLIKYPNTAGVVQQVYRDLTLGMS